MIKNSIVVFIFLFNAFASAQGTPECKFDDGALLPGQPGEICGKVAAVGIDAETKMPIVVIATCVPNHVQVAIKEGQDTTDQNLFIASQALAENLVYCASFEGEKIVASRIRKN